MVEGEAAASGCDGAVRSRLHDDTLPSHSLPTTVRCRCLHEQLIGAAIARLLLGKNASALHEPDEYSRDHEVQRRRSGQVQCKCAFAGLVPKQLASEPASRGAAEPAHPMQRSFTNPSSVGPSAAFVDRVGDKRGEAEDGDGCEVGDESLERERQRQPP